jgi:predicted amidohydrolase
MTPYRLALAQLDPLLADVPANLDRLKAAARTFSFRPSCSRAAFLGHRMVVTPRGQVLCEDGEGEEVLITDIDPNQIGQSKKAFVYLRHRRPELYG